MKKNIFILCLMAYSFSSKGQYFTGILKFLIVNEAAGKQSTDSMVVIVGRKQLKITCYHEEKNKRMSKVVQNSFIEDFDHGLHVDLSSDGYSYHESPLELNQLIQFDNTYKFEPVDNQLCLIYRAEGFSSANSIANREEALCGINYAFDGPSNYLHLGVLPIIIDGRAVLQYRKMGKDGIKRTVTCYKIIPLKNTASYFELWGLKAK